MNLIKCTVYVKIDKGILCCVAIGKKDSQYLGVSTATSYSCGLGWNQELVVRDTRH